MTRRQLINRLQSLELDLRSARIERFFGRQSPEIRRHFVSQRDEIAMLLEWLRDLELEEIADKLDELSPQIEKGLRELRESIEALDTAIDVINGLTQFLGFVARVVAFLA